MKIIFIILGYLHWHYSKAIVSLSSIWKNFFFCTFEYFSLKKVLKNFVAPWKRLDSAYPKSFDFTAYLSIFIVNIIVRIVGVLLRSGLVVLGLVSIFIMLILYPILLILWLALPFIIIGTFILGIILLFK